MLKIMTLILLSTPVFAATVIPFERDVPRVSEYSFITSTNQESRHFSSAFGGDENNELYYRGFYIQNVGPNIIVPTEPTSVDFANREYFFMTDDRSKRDTYIWMTDYIGSGWTSDYFETVLMFLPRKNQMHVEESDQDLIVTLSTGEEVTFFKKYKTLNGGVLKEAPVDFNPNRNMRSHAQISYSGKGTIIRSDAKGADPRLASSVQILKGELKPCKLPGSIFWTQEDFPKFKFVSDEEAYEVIKEKCGTQYLPEI